MSLKSKYTFLQRVNINEVYNLFLGLPPQQQTLALIGAGLLALFIVLLPISLASSKIGKMEKNLNLSKNEMGNIVYEIDDYSRKKSQLEAIEGGVKTGFDTALATTIESLAQKAQMQDNIESIKERPVAPSELFDESSVEVRISKITLQQLINFLYSIEYDKDKLLRVKDLRIKTRFDNKQLLDVSFQVSTFRLQQEA